MDPAQVTHLMGSDTYKKGVADKHLKGGIIRTRLGLKDGSQGEILVEQTSCLIWLSGQGATLDGVPFGTVV